MSLPLSLWHFRREIVINCVLNLSALKSRKNCAFEFSNVFMLGTKNSSPCLSCGIFQDEVPTGMPCLESVTIGDDIWDENWLPLQAKMGKAGGPASHLFTSSLVGKKQYQTRGETTRKVRVL